MDFWDLTKLMFRRWYVSVPLFLVAIGATLFVAVRVEPDYVATSYVQLLPPAITPKAVDDTKASARNPWLDSGLASLTKAAMISVQDQKVVEQLKTTGFSDDFTVTQDAQLPIVTFEVIGDDEKQATATSEQLVKRYTDSVQSLQKDNGAPGDQMIAARRLDLGDNVEVSNSKVKRALIAVAGAGILLAMALTVAVDAWLRRRDRKRGSAPPAPTTAATTAATEPNPPVRADASAPPPPGTGESPARGAAPAVTAKRATTPSPERSGGEYASQSSRSAGPGEETTVLSVSPGEETIVLPSPSWQARNGRANGSKLP